jgi:hypothetical protein
MPFQIDMNKVKLDVLKPWITRKIAEFLKMDDDVVVEFVFNQLEEKVRQLFLFVSSDSCIILGTVLNVNRVSCVDGPPLGQPERLVPR